MTGDDKQEVLHGDHPSSRSKRRVLNISFKKVINMVCMRNLWIIEKMMRGLDMAVHKNLARGCRYN